MEKEYKIFKTIKKTAKENNLIFSNGNLFDFSLLDEIDISDGEKEIIMEHSMKYVSPAFLEQFYGKKFDDFYCCDGLTLFHCKHVYSSSSKTWKRLYCIYTLAKIEHCIYHRTCVWDEYDTEKFTAINGYTQPSDAEI